MDRQDILSSATADPATDMLIYLKNLGLDHMADSDRQSSISSSRAQR